MALSSGIYSLIGVVVGGGVTLGTQWGLAARSDRLDTRVARRKVRAELRQHRQAVEGAASYEVHSYEDLEMLVDELERPGTAAWAKQSDRLARQLGESDWDAIERAYERAAKLVSIVHEERSPPSEAEFRLALAAIEDAISRLS